MSEPEGDTAAERKREKPLQPSQCRSYMRKRLAERFPEIVEGFMKGAESGSCAHVKLATELLEMATGERKQQKKGSAIRLLEELEREGF